MTLNRIGAAISINMLRQYGESVTNTGRLMKQFYRDGDSGCGQAQFYIYLEYRFDCVIEILLKPLCCLTNHPEQRSDHLL